MPKMPSSSAREWSPKLDGRVAIITGAGSGLGRASALTFAEEGARVVVADINSERAHAATETIVEAGGTAVAVQCDVAHETEVAELVGRAIREYGDVDIMFNNAGITMERTNIEDVTDDDLQRIVGVNLRGVFYGCKHAVPVMKAKRSGVILNTSSAGAITSLGGGTVYTMTKGGINALSRELAVELGPFNIRVNSMCPMGGGSANMLLPPDAALVDENLLHPNWDPANTPYVLATPRPPRLADHARVALFLASDDAFWCSGVCMPVDGATTVRTSLNVDRVISALVAGAEGTAQATS
jgi:hypothetical protein